MLFTSLDFFLFLLVTLLLFAAAPARTRWLLLLVASCVFYGYTRPTNLLYLGGLFFAAWLAASALQRSDEPGRRRLLLAAGLTGVLGSLVVFKFFDFFAGEIERGLNHWLAAEAHVALPRLGLAAPAGYSFIAFAAASFLIDTYRRKIVPNASAFGVATYLAWFPKILAGPIERATTFLPRMAGALRPTPEQIVLGSQLIVWGLFKKVVIADNLAPVVDHAFGIVAFASPIELALAVYFFAFQIYCDFSGYTDIAIGVSLLFGVELMENFRRPYLSQSTAEFWGERWHISLGHWFRDYLYIPLGGSRAGTTRLYVNLMIVFLVSGLWHAGLGYGVGWSFLVWGALNGAYQCAGVATRPLWTRLGTRWPSVASAWWWRLLRILVTFHLIAVTWIFFRAKSIGDAWTVMRKIGAHAGEFPALLGSYPFTVGDYLGAALIALLLVVELVDERRSIFQRLAAAPVAIRWGMVYAALGALAILGHWQVREFIYMQF